MKNIFSIISALLGIAALVLFLHISGIIPLWGKVAYILLCIANIVNCIIAAKRFNDGKLALNPILSFVAQLALSFGVLAIVS